MSRLSPMPPPRLAPAPDAGKVPRNPLDRRLPPELRGAQGFPALVKGIRLRVSIAGTCSTFALARATHAALRGRRLRALAKVATPARARAPSLPAAYLALPMKPATFLLGEVRRKAFDEALVADLKRAWPLEALVVASGARGRSLREFNRMVQATHVLVPGVARDPVDGSLRPDEARSRAVSIARSVPEGAALVSGERDLTLRKVLRQQAERAGATFVDAAPHRTEATTPGLEVPTIIDALLRSTIGRGLSPAERVQAMARLQRRLRWQPAALRGLRWFDGTALPNAPSLRAVLDHLGQSGPARVHAVVYVHRDHAREAAWLGPVLRQALEDGALAHCCLVGAGATTLAEELRHVSSSLLLDRRSTVDSVTRNLAREGPGTAIVTLGDTAGTWPKTFASRLQLPDLAPGAWVPLPDLAPPAADAGLAIAPAPVMRVPSLGRRPVVNILGDLDKEMVPDPAPARSRLPRLPAPTAPTPRRAPAFEAPMLAH